ncbi:dihydrolipoamide dehydrogenase [Marinobacter sp. ELB17]|nr:dihydrolipoamide dehydrogenase [Marinobacter sp. ELB17]
MLARVAEADTLEKLEALKSQGITASPFEEMVAQPGGTDSNLLCLE